MSISGRVFCRAEGAATLFDPCLCLVFMESQPILHVRSEHLHLDSKLMCEQL